MSIRSLSKISERLRRQLQLVELLEQTQRDDPVFFEELRKEWASTNGAVPATRKPRSGGRPKDQNAFQAICSVFDETEEEWIETQEIIHKSGLNKAKTAYVLRESHADHFQSRTHPDNQRKKQWRRLGDSEA